MALKVEPGSYTSVIARLRLSSGDEARRLIGIEKAAGLAMAKTSPLRGGDNDAQCTLGL